MKDDFVVKELARIAAKGFAPKTEEESKKPTVRNNARLLYLPIMNDYTTGLTYYGLSQAEDVALLLTDIKNTVDEGFSDQHPDVRGRILIACFQHALAELKADVAKRRGLHIELPDEAPARYIPRQSGKASEFLQEHYGRYISAGVCFRPDIKRLDPKLEQALTNEFRGRTDELRAILPTKADEVDARIARELGGPVRPEDRQAASTVLSMTSKLKRRST